MDKNKDKRVLKNIGISMVIKPIAMILSMLYIPMVLNYLGEEKYGFWTVLLSVISWMNYFDIGIGKGLRNQLTAAFPKNEEKSKSIISTAYLSSSLISFLFFLIFTLICVCFNVPKIFNLELVSENAVVIILISTGFICINFVFSLSKEIMYSLHKPVSVSVQALGIQILNIIVIILMNALTEASVLYLSIMYGISTLIGNLVLQILINSKYKCLKPTLYKFDKTLFKSMISFGLLLFMQNICSLILNSTDSLLIARYFGIQSVTPYNIVFSVFNVIMSVFYIIITPLWAEYTEAGIRNDYKWIKKELRRVNYIIVFFTIIIFILIFFFKPLVFIWLGKKLTYPTYLILLMGIYTILNMVANNYNCALQGLGKMKGPSFLAAVEAILNIPLSIFFAVHLNIGIVGIMLGSAIMLTLSAIFCPIFLYREVNRLEAANKISQEV